MKMSLIIFIIFNFVLNAQAITKNEEKNSITSEERFLINLGFEDFNKTIQENLKNTNLKPISRMALTENSQKYEILNISRKLSTLIYTNIKNKLAEPDFQDRVARLSAHLLRPHFEIKNYPLPQYFSELSEQSFNQAKSEFYKKSNEKINSFEILFLSSYIVDLIEESQKTKINDSKKESILKYLHLYLENRNNYGDLSHTNYLGRALAALLVRHSKINSIKSLPEKIDNYLQKQEDRLSNYTTSNYVFKNRDHLFKTVNLKAGDFAHTYSNEAESFLISAGVKPGSLENHLASEKYGLINSLLDLKDFPTPSKEKVLKTKIERDIELTEREKRLYNQLKQSSTGKGFSHVGLIDVKKDHESEIEMIWVWDVYPSKNRMGARFIGLESLMPPEKVQKIGFSRYDANLFKKYYNSKKLSEGYIENVWNTYEPDILLNGLRINQSKRKTSLKTKITEIEYTDLLNYPDDDFQKWYDQEIIPRVLTQMKNNIISEEAHFFAKSFINIEGAKYCSQAIVLAFLQGVNIDPQPVHDKWKFSVGFIGRIVPSIGNKLDLNERIISPSGFMWQDSLTKNVFIDYLETKTARNQLYNNNFSLLISYQSTQDYMKTLIEKLALNSI